MFLNVLVKLKVYFSYGSWPWKMVLMILMISAIFCKSAFVMPVYSCATI